MMFDMKYIMFMLAFDYPIRTILTTSFETARYRFMVSSGSGHVSIGSVTSIIFNDLNTFPHSRVHSRTYKKETYFGHILKQTYLGKLTYRSNFIPLSSKSEHPFGPLLCTCRGLL